MRPQRRLPAVSAKENLILDRLLQGGEMYGLELVAASGGELKRGTVYVTLGRMEEKGYVASRLEEAPPAAGGLPRRMYTVTALGRQVRDTWQFVASRLAPVFSR